MTVADLEELAADLYRRAGDAELLAPSYKHEPDAARARGKAFAYRHAGDMVVHLARLASEEREP